MCALHARIGPSLSVIGARVAPVLPFMDVLDVDVHLRGRGLCIALKAFKLKQNEKNLNNIVSIA
jgi:hypothetical protein